MFEKILNVNQPSTAYGTSLPASPYDTQLAVLVDNASTPTYQWMFRYNAGSANADKWEFVGGSPALAEVVTDETTSSTTYAALTTAGPSFTIPRAGVYEISVGFDVVSPDNSGGINMMSYDIGGTGAADADATSGQRQGTWARCSYYGMPRIKTGIAASASIVSKYRITAGASQHFANRRLLVRPVRVS